jgi:excisionase family DNA binding protein
MTVKDMSISSTGLNDVERGCGLLDSPRWRGHNTFTVPEAAEILRISKWAAYEGVKKGELPVIWIGRRCLIPRLALERMLSGVARPTMENATG